MKTLEHISEKPWSEYSESDYSLEQWHNACLIHLHDGAPTSKSQCKLPVKTPNGAINRNGVHAAAGALAGARGGVKAPEAELNKAKAAIVRLYSQLDETPPKSISQTNTKSFDFNKFIEHVGVKGMRWGVRKAAPKPSIEGARTNKIVEKQHEKGMRSLTNHELQQYNKRLQMETEFKRLTPPKQNVIKKGDRFVKEALAIGATVNAAYAFSRTPVGKKLIGQITNKSKPVSAIKKWTPTPGYM